MAKHYFAIGFLCFPLLTIAAPECSVGDASHPAEGEKQLRADAQETGEDDSSAMQLNVLHLSSRSSGGGGNVSVADVVNETIQVESADPVIDARRPKNETMQVESSDPVIDARRPKNETMQVESSDTVIDARPPKSYLAYGWTLTTNSATLVAPQKKKKLFKESPRDISELPVNMEYLSEEETLRSAFEFGVKALDKSAKNQPVLDGFSLFANLAWERQGNNQGFTEARAEKKFIFVKQRVVWKRRKSDRFDALSKKWKKFLLREKNMATIAEKMGDFYATEVEMGGRAALTSYFSTFEWDTTDDITNLFRVADASFCRQPLDGRFRTETVNWRRVQTKMSVLGGDPQKYSRSVIEFGFDEAASRWSKTVTKDNQVPVMVKLEPIWELLKIQNPNKSRELQQYMTERWRSMNNDFPAPNYYRTGVDIKVYVTSASNLQDADWAWWDKSDPYVKVRAITRSGEFTFETQRRDNTHEPSWNEEKTIDGWMSDTELEFTVMDHNSNVNHKFLGKASVSPRDIWFKSGESFGLPLDVQGELNLRIDVL